jgi:hypothetical protein
MGTCLKQNSLCRVATFRYDFRNAGLVVGRRNDGCLQQSHRQERLVRTRDSCGGRSCWRCLGFANFATHQKVISKMRILGALLTMATASWPTGREQV